MLTTVQPVERPAPTRSGMSARVLLGPAARLVSFGHHISLFIADPRRTIRAPRRRRADRKSTRLNSSHANISYAVFCLKKKTTHNISILSVKKKKKKHK